MATYQGERFVAEQLESIVSQLGEDDEIVVSDDGSTDSTLEVVRRRADPRVRILANGSRVGYVRNFARAIAAARGSEIFFSDQDDVWLPRKVALQRAALARRACVASDAVVVDERLEVLGSSYFQLRGARSFSPLGIFLKPPIIGATIACRADYLRTLLPFPADISHDLWITFNAAADGVLESLSEPLILYRRHSAVASLSASGKRRPAAAMIAERLRLLAAWARRRRRRRPDRIR
jgi:glycosyltransferase involved in cell wall biosynthesis